MSGFTGKVAIVTGGTSGIGRATAVAYAREGAKVVVAGRREAEGEETVRLIGKEGGDGIFVATDVTKETDVKNLVGRTLEKIWPPRRRLQQRGNRARTDAAARTAIGDL